MEKKVALVTGSYRGIGFETVRQLALADFIVILTARDEKKGLDAVVELQRLHLQVSFHQLDVSDEKSIDALYSFVEKKYGTLDVLVNNAGILPNVLNVFTVPLSNIEKTFETNFYGPLRMSRKFFPLLEKSRNGRIINVSSGMGSLEHMGEGYAAYRMSKTALNSLTVVMAADTANSRVKINSMCPGWVRTTMGGSSAPRTVEQGADTIVWLATEKDIPTGKFFRDRKVIPW